MTTYQRHGEACGLWDSSASQSLSAGDPGELSAHPRSSPPFESGAPPFPAPEGDAAPSAQGDVPDGLPPARSTSQAPGSPASVVTTHARGADGVTASAPGHDEGGQPYIKTRVHDINVIQVPLDEQMTGSPRGAVDVPEPALASPRPVRSSIREMLNRFRIELAGIVTRVAALQDEQSAQAQLRAVFMETAARNRQLEEQFYEHEVLGGISRMLIGLADCARDVRARLTRNVERDAILPVAEVCTSCASVLEYIDLHIVNIHTSLTTLGVESYTIPGPDFNPMFQRCVARVPVLEQRRHGEIASRVAPGYRRNGHVIRHEQVRVCVVAHDALPAQTGD